MLRPGSRHCDRPEVLAAREAAWRAYFGGDVKTLGDLLPEEFIGISMNEGPFADRNSAMQGARAFHWWFRKSASS